MVVWRSQELRVINPLTRSKTEDQEIMSVKLHRGDEREERGGDRETVACCMTIMKA